MLKIELYSSYSSYQVIGEQHGPKQRPIIRPSQFYGMFRNAKYGNNNSIITDYQIHGIEYPKNIREQHNQATEIFNGITKFTSITNSIGNHYTDLQTINPKKWNGQPILELSGRERTRPLEPIKKVYWSDPHHTIYIDGTNNSLDEIYKAFNNPQDFISIGRKSCQVDELKIAITNSPTIEQFAYAGSTDGNLSQFGIDASDPNHFKQKIWPGNEIGQFKFCDWYEVDGPGASPNYRLANTSGEFVYIIYGCQNREWAHNIVHKYFGAGNPWYIDNINRIIIYSKMVVNKCGDLQKIRRQIRPKYNVPCSLIAIPRENNTDSIKRAHNKLQYELGITLEHGRSIYVDGKPLNGNAMQLLAIKYNFTLDPVKFKALVYDRYGRSGTARGYGAIMPDRIEDIT